MEFAERLHNLNTLIAEYRLLRGKWTDKDEHGRQRACLLAALSPEVAASKSASKCPSDVMPTWLAVLTPAIDDNGSLSEWSSVVARYANLASRWKILSEDNWKRAEMRIRIKIVQAVKAAVTDRHVIEFCREYLTLAVAQGEGRDVPTSEWSKLNLKVEERGKQLNAGLDNYINLLRHLEKLVRQTYSTTGDYFLEGQERLRAERKKARQLEANYYACSVIMGLTNVLTIVPPETTINAAKPAATVLMFSSDDPTNAELAWDKVIPLILDGIDDEIKMVEQEPK